MRCFLPHLGGPAKTTPFARGAKGLPKKFNSYVAVNAVT